MKKNLIIITIITLALLSCNNNDDGIPSNNLTFNFTQNWDEENVTLSDFNEIKYTNANGENLSLERLRYLISNITLENENGIETVLEGYQLIDITKPETLEFKPNTAIPNGTYNNISITFGFNEEDNIDGAYADLNTAVWNVPVMLGGGYHYMQLEGKFINTNQETVGYQYHAIKANKRENEELVLQETFIQKDLGEVTINGDTTIEIKMNVAEWFKNPNIWDLNELGGMLMPNFEAQLMINENGQGVFSLGEVSQ